jgi:hypothetical protein
VTRVQTGLALTTAVDVEPGRRTLAVRRPGALEARHTLDVGAETWVGVSASPDGAVAVRVQDAPFGYV